MATKDARDRLAQICADFNVTDIYELAELHLKHDQESIRNESANIDDASLIQNKIKDALLLVDLRELPDDEQKVAKNILWLWHHHAATIAVWQKHNLSRARTYCDTALQYLYPEHPNRITPMLCMLLHGNIEGAREWSAKEVGPVERAYADHLLEEYAKGTFKEKPSAPDSAEG